MGAGIWGMMTRRFGIGYIIEGCRAKWWQVLGCRALNGVKGILAVASPSRRYIRKETGKRMSRDTVWRLNIPGHPINNRH